MLPIPGILAFARSPLAKWVGLVALVALLAWRGYVVVFDRGVASCEGVHAEALAKAVELAKADAHKIALRDAKAIYLGIAEREKIRIIYRDREKEIVKHVPIDCNQCRFTPSGIGLLNDALSNVTGSKTPNTGSQPPTSPQSQPPGGDRNLGGNGSIVDNRQWKVL